MKWTWTNPRRLTKAQPNTCGRVPPRERECPFQEISLIEERQSEREIEGERVGCYLRGIWEGKLEQSFILCFSRAGLEVLKLSTDISFTFSNNGKARRQVIKTAFVYGHWVLNPSEYAVKLCYFDCSGQICHRKPTASSRRNSSSIPFYMSDSFIDTTVAEVRDTVASLTATKSITKKKKLRSRQKKLRAYDLSTLSESLPELKGPKRPPPTPKFKLNCKSRTELVVNESKRLKEVLSDRAYQEDPLGYIYQHLQRTLPITEEKPKNNSNKDGGKKKKKKKKKKAKASGAPTSMDI
ncbi:hypothetical protein CRG98_020967 [Punica granatum]|uniref:Uncharacterized protein n=1 Tax=Punica granatum TaxID=22663 RepID=A0A2I0JQX8_PUNGR|nr:hypothetical protein CRG98_020967 [Punica granatum]